MSENKSNTIQELDSAFSTLELINKTDMDVFLMSENKSNTIQELDSAFSTLELINKTDMDVFLKIIMLVNKSASESLRGEINHLMQSRIDSDPKLRELLMSNNYLDFDHTYLQQSFKIIKNAKINAYKNNIKQTIIKIMEIDGVEFIYNIILKYFDNLWYQKEISSLNFNPDLCENKNYVGCVREIYENLVKILGLLSDNQNSACNFIFSGFSPLGNFGKFTFGLRILFEYPATLFTYDYNVHINFMFRDMEKDLVSKICNYFNSTRGFNFDADCCIKSANLKVEEIYELYGSIHVEE
jgi:hypothetical protein